MTANQVRDLFAESSGRLDLLDGTGTVNDLFFLNAGARYLDVKWPQKESKRWYKYDIAINAYQLEISNLRNVLEVWVVGLSEDGYQLVRKDLGWLKENYPDQNISDIDTGDPKYFTESLLRLSPQQKALTSSDYTDEFSYHPYDVLFDTTYAKRGIYFMPPADATFTMEVLGEFYSESLTEDDDLNYWTVHYPEVLVQAAVLCLERFYRNFEGYRVQVEVINDMMKGVTDDIIQQSVTGGSRMEG